MTDTTNQTQANGEKRKPTHRVTFQQKTKNGYGPTVDLGGGWQNSKGGINFAFAGGYITIWPADRDQEAG